jgi:hypothetical protein
MSRVAQRVTKQLAIAAMLSLLITGCGSSSPPTVPSATPPPTATATGGLPPGIVTGSSTISGVVTESGRPIANANVNAWVQSGSGGYSYMYVHGPLLTDPSGRYRMTGLAIGAHLWFQTYKDGYVQQCAAPSVTVSGDMAMDLALVSKTNLTASAMPSGAGLRGVSGTIVEVSAIGKQPVANVFVDFEPTEDFPAAITYSDSTGRFALCGLPANTTVTIGAGLGNRVAYANVPPGQTDIEIVLP